MSFLASAKKLDDSVLGPVERRWPPKSRRQQAARAKWLLPICVLAAAVSWVLVARGIPAVVGALALTGQAVWLAGLILRGRGAREE